MNPGFDRIFKEKQALLAADASRNADMNPAPSALNLPAGMTIENCVQHNQIVFCRDHNLLEEAVI